MRYIYHVRTDQIVEKEGVHTVYGIDIWRLPDRDARLFRSVPNLFCDKMEAEALAALCNRLELDPAKLSEIIQTAKAQKKRG